MFSGARARELRRWLPLLAGIAVGSVLTAAWPASATSCDGAYLGREVLHLSRESAEPSEEAQYWTRNARLELESEGRIRMTSEEPWTPPLLLFFGEED